MKKIILFLLICAICILSFSACGKAEKNVPECDAVIAAYEEAGYHVFHDDNLLKEDGSDADCSIKVWLDDEYNAAFFYFYESADAAKEAEKDRRYNILIYLFSVIYGDPTWVHMGTCGNIHYEYEDKELMKPFGELTK